MRFLNRRSFLGMFGAAVSAMTFWKAKPAQIARSQTSVLAMPNKGPTLFYNGVEIGRVASYQVHEERDKSNRYRCVYISCTVNMDEQTMERMHRAMDDSKWVQLDKVASHYSRRQRTEHDWIRNQATFESWM